MSFPINNADEVMDAKKIAKDIPAFKADDTYINTLIKDNVIIENNTCNFTQILKIDENKIPDGLDNNVVIDNAKHIMNFYKQWNKKSCGIIEWAVFTTINPSTEDTDAQTALGKSIADMDGEKELYKMEGSG